MEGKLTLTLVAASGLDHIWKEGGPDPFAVVVVYPLGPDRSGTLLCSF